MRLSVTVARVWICVMAVVLVGVFAVAPTACATTLQEELDLGKKLDQQILKETPLASDKQAAAELTEYGNNLIKNVRRPEIPYTFRIIKDDDLNAFAIPGGFVYFSERLWDVLRKDERIGVLAHEIVHVDRRHALDAISKQQRRQIWLAVILTATRANQTLADIASIAHSAYSLKYTRADERQADEVGLQLTNQANYNPAGLLLAMRKIGRFHGESGGETPKIFSSHPPTKERLQYMQSMLEGMGVPIPPDNPIQEDAKHRIGDLVAVNDTTVQFTSSHSLSNGQTVWLMKNGWDYHYEKKTAVPTARATVRSQMGSKYTADVVFFPNTSAKDIAKGTGVYDPPKPKAEQGYAKLLAGTPGRVTSGSALNKGDRFLARGVVWNKENTALVYDNTGYIVLTNKSGGVGYVSVARAKYAYVPLSAGAELVRYTDPDKARWMGPILSIGRGGQTIELGTERDTATLASDLKAGKKFDVVYPPWAAGEAYEKRIAGKAALKSLEGKIVLQMASYAPGWSIQNLQVGFDIYEAKP